MTHIITATATRRWRIAVATLVSALLAGGTFMAISPDTASADTCPFARNVDRDGLAIAHWTLTCTQTHITVRGFVVDKAADGKCAQVRGHVGKDKKLRTSLKACPKGDVKTFVWTELGNQAFVCLSIFGRCPFEAAVLTDSVSAEKAVPKTAPSTGGVDRLPVLGELPTDFVNG